MKNLAIITLGGLFFIFALFYLSTQELEKESENNLGNFYCPMYKCNIYRNGNPIYNPKKNNVSEPLQTIASSAPEGTFSETLDNNSLFQASPIYVDFDLDGIDEIVTYYKNTLYNKTKKTRTFQPFIMLIKYNPNPTELERLEFGEAKYIRYWYFPLEEEVHTSFSVGDLNSDGYPEVYFGCDDGKVYGLNSQGELVFEFEAGDKVRSTPATYNIDSDRKQEIVFGSDDGSIYALNYLGELKWKFDTNGTVRSSPTIFSNNSKNYITIGSDDGKLYLLTGSGELVCSYDTGDKVRSSPLYYGGKIVFGSDTGNIYLIDEHCKLIKEYSTGDRIRSSPAVFKDNFLIGSDDGNLYFFNETGIIHIELGSHIESVPVVINQSFTIIASGLDEKESASSRDINVSRNPYYTLDGGILVSVSSGKIYLLDEFFKKIVFETPNPSIFSCSPSIGNKNTLSCYFETKEGETVLSGFSITPLELEIISRE